MAKRRQLKKCLATIIGFTLVFTMLNFTGLKNKAFAEIITNVEEVDAPAEPLAGDPNRLANLDFEMASEINALGWTLVMEPGMPQNSYLSSTDAAVAGKVYRGDNSLALVKYGGNEVYVHSQGLSAAPDTAYTLEGFVYIHDQYNPGNVYVRVHEYDRAGEKIKTNELLVAPPFSNGSWLKTTLQFTTGSDTGRIRIDLGLKGGSSLVVCFDDFLLTGGPAAIYVAPGVELAEIPSSPLPGDPNRLANLDFEVPVGASTAALGWTPVIEPGQSQDAYLSSVGAAAGISYRGNYSYTILKYGGNEVYAYSQELCVTSETKYTLEGFVYIHDEYNPGNAYVRVTEYDSRGQKITENELLIPPLVKKRWLKTTLQFTASERTKRIKIAMGLRGGTSLTVCFDDFSLSGGEAVPCVETVDTPSVPLPADPGRLANMDFELNAWTLVIEPGQSQDGYRSATKAYRGAYSQNLIKYGGNEVYVHSKEIYVIPDTAYTLEGFLNIDNQYNPGNAYVRVFEYDANNQEVAVSELLIPPIVLNQWLKMTLSFSTDSNTRSIKIALGFKGGTTLVGFFDDFSLKLDTPRPPLLEDKTETGITLAAAVHHEEVAAKYGISENGADITWQEGNLFEGLNPDTEYRFYTKLEAVVVCEGQDYPINSGVSKPANIKTSPLNYENILNQIKNILLKKSDEIDPLYQSVDDEISILDLLNVKVISQFQINA